MSGTVLAVGIDPHAMTTTSGPASGAPAVDAAAIRAGAAASQQRLTKLGFDVDVCFLDPAAAATAADAFGEKIHSRRYDFVMIGAGLRLDPAHTHLFEILVNTTRQAQPGAVLVFNTDPASSAAAVERWHPHPTPVADTVPH